MSFNSYNSSSSSNRVRDQQQQAWQCTLEDGVWRLQMNSLPVQQDAATILHQCKHPQEYVSTSWCLDHNIAECSSIRSFLMLLHPGTPDAVDDRAAAT